MVLILRFICVALYKLTAIMLAEGATKTGLNAIQYGILCDVYNAASSTVPALYDKDEVEKTLGQIDAVNMSVSAENWVSEIKNAAKDPKAAEEFKKQYGIADELWNRLEAAVKAMDRAGPGTSQLIPESPALKRTRRKLALIETQAQKIVDSIKKEAQEAKVDEIKRDLEAAIGTCEKDGKGCENRDTRSMGRETACGTASAAKGSLAGKTLIDDFFCLCSSHTGGQASTNCGGSSGSQKACGDECTTTTGETNGKWSAGKVTNPADLWKNLREGCAQTKVGKEFNPAAAQAVLNRFLGEINKNSGSGTNTHGILGGIDGTASGGCTGIHNSAAGICVAYGKEPENWLKDGDDGRIEWLVKIQGVLNRFPEISNITRSIQQGVAHLKTLQTRAEEIYEETKLNSEFGDNIPHNPTQVQNKTATATTDKATAQEPNSVNTAIIPHVILPWTLLL